MEVRCNEGKAPARTGAQGYGMALKRDRDPSKREDAKLMPEHNPLTDIGGDRHSRLRELCVVYCDSCREVLLNEFVMWFVGSATKPELATLRKEIAAQTRRIDQREKAKGRPRAEDNLTWLENARDAAFKRIVEGWSWKRLTESEGKKPTKPNIQTLKNRQERYAGIIWEACSEAGVWQPGSRTEADISRLRDGLETTALRRTLCRRALLRFSIVRGQDRTAECKQVVMTLAPKGRKIVAKQFARLLDRLSKHRKRSQSRSLK
jgi:hypothetical protein